MASDDEPLNWDLRKVQQYSGLYINLTGYGVNTGNIDKGDQLVVEVYPEGIVIPFDDPREEDDADE